MGVDTRRPALPAPTDSSAIDSNGGSITPTDLATDLSRRTDKTSHTVPDDGRPITIATGKKRRPSGKLSKSQHHSQTSLMIEIFEAGKSQDIPSRPSVRVKVRPSASRKSGEKGDSEIVVTEAHGSRKPSYRRRISLGTDSPKQAVDVGSISSLSSLSEESRLAHRGAPIEVEVLPKEGSERSGTSVSKTPRFIVPSSDISSMPADSMLEGNPPPVTTRPERSRSLSREEVVEHSNLKTPTRRRSRSLSRERLTQKVLEKLTNRPQEVSSSRKRHGEKSSSQRGSKDHSGADARSHGRLSSRQQEDASIITGTESSIHTNSALSANRKSGDQISFKSATSKSSVNNPKLLNAFEDIIQRVIMPELKELKKDKKVALNRSKFEKIIDQSDVSGSSISREEIQRRVSKHGSAPELKVRDSAGKGSSESRRRKHKRKEADLDSPSERSFRRRESGDSLSLEEERNQRRKSKDQQLRNIAAGALVGGALTTAALQHHDSGSSLDGHERRKQSKSRSRSTSIAETEEIFDKHLVPPMPMQSEIETELTRSSLLSDQTATAPFQGELRQVSQGSPREVVSSASRETGSPASRTPTRTPADLRKGLGTYHGNLSNRDLSSYNRGAHGIHDDQKMSFGEATPASPTIATGSLDTHHLLADEERQRRYESNLHHQHPIRRGLSPIQSVASYNMSEPNRNSFMLARSSNSLASLNEEQQLKEERSVASLSSPPNTNLARNKRPEGINLETGSVILGQHDSGSQEYSRDIDADAFFDEQHSENERYRDSYANSDPRVNYRNFTDDSLDASYLEKMSARRPVTRGQGANPEYVHAPLGVESAVASLYDPSMESVGSTRSSAISQADSIERQKRANQQFKSANLHARDSGSPLKQEYAHDEKSFQQRVGVTSPPQSVAPSEDDRDMPQLGASAVPVSSDPMPEIGMDLDSPQSEITTNPSVIHGPIGGSTHGDRDHWPYNATPPSKNGLVSPASENRGLGMTDATLAGGALGAAGLGAVARGHEEQSKDMPAGLNLRYDTNAAQDEGYISAANPGTYSPDPKVREHGGYSAPVGRSVSPAFSDDPFLAKHSGHLSTTEKGIEGIQSKDIVALMDHLTVRDARRNARDTEILVTLVRSAAEMRNSFEDMKRFIAEQDDFIMDTADKQHEKTVQKVINGPRPPPLVMPLLPTRPASEEDEDAPAKRRNVFKRALRGLGTKNTAELQNIEAMLMRLLGEVEGLRAGQEGRPVNSRAQSHSVNSVENAREPTDPGYEPEGQAGTSSTGDRSGFFSNNSSRQADHRGGAAGHRDSTNRVSTVMEGDEELESRRSGERDVMDQQFTNGRTLLSPDRETPDAQDTRGASTPLRTPPRIQPPENRAFSNENTPQMSADGKSHHRKQKSSSSSFYPKMISRWSKTTASSIIDNFRGNAQVTPKSQPYSQVSQSGSNPHVGEYDYDPQEDALRTTHSYLNEEYAGHENRPPSPLIPSQVSDNPKYHAHRNSMNLQHPQPRQGPTGRFQNHLENEAQTYTGEQFSPTSQSSSMWGHQQGIVQTNPLVQGNANAQNRYSGYSGNDRLSPISDTGYSESSSAILDLGQEEHERSLKSGASANSVLSASGYRRQRKSRDEEPLIPQRPPKLPMSPAGSRQSNYVDHVSAARAGSPAYDQSPVAALRSPQSQTRKPSGPRPQRNSGQYSPGHLNNIKRTRFRGSPNQVETSTSSDEYR
ncbi:hypothetical protein GJ744_009077 [Endocarpon pusillum]|uniref:Uncharacterized protein n=1 Tax=Endocarpon pusillum TaxID=364733 RepID=A0A8H7AP88_9EURO|nr:hypothetical protein GJ744_009077 [Endocarpon pusillum]